MGAWRLFIAFVALACLLLSLAAQPAAAQPTGVLPTNPRAGLPGDIGGRLGHILQRGRLIVGVKADYPPWGMIDGQGHIVGLEPDLAQMLAEGLGVDLELVAVSASNRLQLLEQGRIDLVIATMGDTEERRGISDLLQPHYYDSGVRLLARDDSLFTDWGQLRGRTVCLVDGAYFNRTLVERFLLDPLVFKGNRDAMMALNDGRCVGWAFDDTVLAQILRDGDAEGLSLSLPTILSTPWTIAVRKGEGETPLGRFVSDQIAEWHRDGTITALQAKWSLPPTDFLIRQSEQWSEKNLFGAWVCQRSKDGDYPAECFSDRIASTGGGAEAVPQWARTWGARLGLSPDVLFDTYARDRLVSGMQTTVILSLLAIVGALVFGVVFGWIDAVLRRAGGLAVLLRWPLQALFTLARMTPPILQLYLIFFALGAVMASSYAIKPGAFFTAAFVFTLYAGAANAVLVSQGIESLAKAHPDRPTRNLVWMATERVFDGLMASCVNVVKAAGMASTIAVAEVISISNSLIADGGDATTLMNFLLIFYFFFVLLVVWALRLLRLALIGRMPAEQMA